MLIRFITVYNHCRTWLNAKIFKRNQHSELQDSVAGISVRLSNFSKALEATCKHVEPYFLKLGEELQSISSNALELTQRTIETVNLIGGESKEGVLTRIGELAKNSVAELRKRQMKVADNLEKVNDIITHLEHLYEMCAFLERIALFLRIIGLNIDIESSRSIEASEMFGVVAQEMRILSKKVINISENMRQNAKVAQTSQISAHDEIFTGLAQVEKLSSQAEKTLRNAVREIEGFIERSLKVLNQIGEHSKIVTDQIGEVVVGIQLHDSINQRVEHIIKAVRDIQEMLNTVSSDGQNVAEMSGGAYAIIHLQAEQIRQIIAEIDSVYQKKQNAFEKIGIESEAIAHSHAMLGSQNDVTIQLIEKSEINPFTELGAALLGLRDLMGQGRNLINRIQDTTGNTSETTNRLSSLMEQIRTFGFETHLIALNAIIKASHIGEMGSTLEVLSQEMRKLSNQTGEFVAAVQVILDAITTSAHGLQISQEQVLSTAGSARAILDAGIEEITNLYNRFKEDASEVFQRAEAMKHTISKISSGLDFLPSLSVELKELLCQLEKIGRGLSLWVTQNVGITSAEFDKLAERYTMQKERDIHHQILNQAPAITEEQKQELKQLEDETFALTDKNSDKTQNDEMGDNVELF